MLSYVLAHWLQEMISDKLTYTSKNESLKKNAITIKLSTIDENIFNNETGACFSTSTSGGKRGTQRLNAKDMKRCSLDDAKLPTTFIHAD